jgi:hemolysin activation/secretion protein
MKGFSRVLFLNAILPRLSGLAALIAALGAPALALAQAPAPPAATAAPFGNSQDVTRVTPKLPTQTAPTTTITLPSAQVAPSTAADQSSVAVASLQGLVFVSGKEALQPNGVGIDASGPWRVAARKLPLLDNDQFRQMMHDYIGKPFTVADIAKVRQQTNKWLADHDHPFVNATVPPQNVDSGVIQVVVTEYRLGKIEVVGAKYFNANVIRRMSPLRSGQILTGTQITENANLLNSNPFLTPDVNFKEGAVPGTTDMEVKVTDRLPVRVYAGYDNQGVRSLGLDEWNVGINWGNAFGAGQIPSYQYTRSFTGRYASHSLDDVIPLTAVDSLQVFANFAALQPIVADGFNNTGRNFNISARYVRTLPFWSGGLTGAHLRIGYDYKYTDNNLLFIFPGYGAIPLLASAAEVHQFPVILDGVVSDRFGQTAIENDLVYSPGRLTGRNTDAAFESLTAGASAEYVYDKLSITRTTRLPENISWVVRGILQQSNTVLPYTEQLGGGGVGSVRGYYPDTALGSNGLLVSSELRLAGFSPAALIGKPRFPDLMQVGAFYDYGHLYSPKTIAGGQAPVDMAGAGFFLHYAVDRFIDIDFNYGWQLKQVITEPPGLGHYAAIAVVFSN